MVQIALSGHGIFLHRHRQLLEAINRTSLSPAVPIKLDDPSNGLLTKIAFGYIPKLLNYVNPSIKSRRSVRLLKFQSLAARMYLAQRKKDYIIHVFSSIVPDFRVINQRYSCYLDFTMSLAIKQWPEWSNFSSAISRQRWLKAELDFYRSAEWLFVMGDNTAESLFRDYGMPMEKIVVVGSAGTVPTHTQVGSRTTVSRFIMNASDPFRKGLDIAIDAFAIARQSNVNIELYVVGLDSGPSVEGVSYLGHLDEISVGRMLGQSIGLVSPSRCDPFPTFVLEGLSAGLPVAISSSCGMATDIMDGVNGLIANDAYQLAASMVRIERDAVFREAAYRFGKKVSAEKYNWPVIAEHMARKILPTI